MEINVLNSLAMFESPIQIAIVLLIALLVFGPNRLPEIGKQIGNALRELKKAGSDVMSSFNTDHEPDRDYHPYSNGNYDYNYPTGSEHSIAQTTYESSPDLTDYTIAGQAPRDTYGYGYDSHAYNSEHYSAAAENHAADSADYTLAPAGSSSASSTDSTGPVAVASGDQQKEGKTNA